MPSLYFAPALSFEPRFVSYVHHQRLIHKKQTLVVLGLLVLKTIDFAKHLRMAQIEGDGTEEAVMLIASLRQLRH